MKTWLTEKEEREVCAIIDGANAADGTSYTAPTDADRFYLSLHAGEPVAVLAVYGMGDTRNGVPVEEVLLFTRPDFRKKGRAGRLWKKYAADAADRDISVRFSVYACAAAEGFLTHRKAVYDHDEVLMSRHLGGNSERNRTLEELDFPVRNEHSGCAVRTYGTVGYVYGVRTDVSHLREGSAQRLMENVFSRLYDMGASDAVLEVSSANIPAWKLYRKLGFEVKEKLGIWYIDLCRSETESR